MKISLLSVELLLCGIFRCTMSNLAAIKTRGVSESFSVSNINGTLCNGKFM